MMRNRTSKVAAMPFDQVHVCDFHRFCRSHPENHRYSARDAVQCPSLFSSAMQCSNGMPCFSFIACMMCFTRLVEYSLLTPVWCNGVMEAINQGKVVIFTL